MKKIILIIFFVIFEMVILWRVLLLKNSNISYKDVCTESNSQKIIDKEITTDKQNENNDSNNWSSNYSENKTKYNYPDNFILENDLKNAIEEISRNKHFDESYVYSEDWKKDFLDYFIWGDFDGYEYKKSIEDNNKGIMSREQIEYIYNSLTGYDVTFENIDDIIDCNIIKYSPEDSYIIDTYDYYTDNNEIIISANATRSIKGETFKENYIISVRLKKNEYSCFNGYSIVSLDTTEIGQYQNCDNSEHVIVAELFEDDIFDNYMNVVYINSEDELSYNNFVVVELTNTQRKYVLENKNYQFRIKWDFTEDKELPISKIKAKNIEIIE